MPTIKNIKIKTRAYGVLTKTLALLQLPKREKGDNGMKKEKRKTCQKTKAQIFTYCICRQYLLWEEGQNRNKEKDEGKDNEAYKEEGTNHHLL